MDDTCFCCYGWGVYVRYYGGVTPYFCTCNFCDGWGFLF